jgi:hypothetical protein
MASHASGVTALARRPRTRPVARVRLLVRAPVAPGSAVALTGWSPRECAATLLRRHADRGQGSVARL